MKRKLRGEEQARRIHAILSDAYRHRSPLRLTELGLASGNGVLTATIEQLDGEHIRINQPTIGCATVQLVTGGELEFSFEVGNRSWTGRTRNLGRTKIASGGEGVIRGYRLALPDHLEATVRRRATYRLPVGADMAPRAQIQFDSDPSRTISGILNNISVGGAQLVVHEDLKGFDRDDAALLRFELPDPVGQVAVRIRIQMREHRDRAATLGVRFEQDVPNLAQFIRASEIKRIQRAGAA